MTKNDNEAAKLINWNGVSRLLTGGDSNVVRSNNVKMEHRDAVESLLTFVDKWIKDNGKNSGTLSMTVPKNVQPGKRKKRTTEKFYTIIEEVPEGAEVVDPNLWKKGELFYTTIFTSGVGFESREWKNISKARIYLSIKNRENK